MKIKISLIVQIFLVYIISIIPAQASDYHILINIPSRTLELWKDGKAEKTYPVGVGRPGFPTPTGNFKVISKIKNPSWENPYKPAGIARVKPGRHNPLGTRWIGFHRDSKNNEYGMHGTNNPGSVGKYSSHGCIRMHIKDAEHLFDKIEFDDPVKVSYYTHKLIVKNNKLVIRKYPHQYKRSINPRQMVNEQLEMLNQKYIINEKQLNKALKLRNGLSLTVGEIIKTKEHPSSFHRFSEFIKSSFLNIKNNEKDIKENNKRSR